jgi:dynein heavy chain
MMVPDYALIGEIMLFAYGFELAKECGAKMVATFRLCSEQLSSQYHYDYGMRAVKTVIVAAGNLKAKEPDANELQLLLRALQDVNLPKFLSIDLPLFEGIISDLFPGIKRPEIDYGALMQSLKLASEEAGLQPVEFFLRKNIQLYETIVVRHGLMVVGPTGAGKTENLSVLTRALSMLKENEIDGNLYEKVLIIP